MGDGDATALSKVILSAPLLCPQRCLDFSGIELLLFRT